MALVLKEEDAKDWAYKGEGAANLVLSYTGSSASLIGKVLRIKKAEKGDVQVVNGCLVLSKNEQLMWREYEELVKSTSSEVAGQVYTKMVMGPLLDPKNIDGGVRIKVSRQFLEAIKKNVRSKRPAWRVDAADVDTLCDSALLISDHSVFLRRKGTISEGMCFTVEIKPKCGFLPVSEFIAKRNGIKKRITRFRMHQLLKLHKGEISQVSGYNPLDLFSGSNERIYQAINSLFSTPGNNFRIFLNGSLIFGGLGGGMDMTTASLHESNEKFNGLLKVYGLQLSSFIELIAGALQKSAVLDKLLAVQKLDCLDIEGAIHLYYNIISEPCTVCKDITNIEHRHQCSLLHALSLEESMKTVREFLIAATAKDCSLMISFKPADGGSISTEYSSVSLKSCNRSFDYKANFIDLDLKPLDKMVHYYKLDQKIVDHYNKNVTADEKSCASSADCTEEKQLQCQV